MNLTLSQLKYLLVVDDLSEKGSVRASDIAKQMEINRSSAFNMLVKLEDAGMVIKNDNRTVKLTEAGNKIVENLKKELVSIKDKLVTYFGIAADKTEDCALSVLYYKNLNKAD